VEQDKATEREWRSRLRSDPRDGGLAFAFACALHVALLFALFPAEFRHESREDTARRFGYRGPPNYERLIRVRLINSGDPVRGAPAQLIGAVAAETERPFEGKVAPLLARARRESKGNDSIRPVYSEGEDPVARLRSTYGDLPTVQSEDVIVRAVVKPEYPQEAVEKGIEGVVVVVAFVNELGEVEDVALEHSVAEVLDTEAVRAAYRTRFEPYLPGGKLQSVFVRIRYNFELVSTLPG
jgi:TonB family protein